MEASLVLINGKVITLDENFRVAEAIAVKEDKIIAVGRDDEIKKFIGKNTKVVDLKGRTVVPGFEDSHCHLIEYGLSLMRINLSKVKDMDELLERVKTKVESSQQGSWILGRGWDQDKMEWKGRWSRDYKWPTRWDLDTVSPNNPVLLTRVCGHIAVANTLALKLANISKETPDPEGGKIDREEGTNEPTGILRDKAIDLVWNVIPKPTYEELKNAAKLAIKDAVRLGVTSITEAGASWEYLKTYEELYENGELCVRINLLMDASLLNELIKMGIKSPYDVKEKWIRIIGIKLLVDGSLGGRTAYLKEDYNDKPGWKGIALYSQDELNEIVLKANRAGLQVAVHAIGDAANEMVLNSFKKSKENLGEEYEKLRNRIEHCSVLSQEIIRKYSELNVVASIQLSFATSDMAWVESRVGNERIKYTYAWRKLLNSGVKCIGGSDCPVESLDPILGLYHIVNRKSANGTPKNGWYPEECITVKEALCLITKNAAFGAFEEKMKGSIEVGKLADLVVLSKDILSIDPKEILDVKVEMTIVGGKIVYDTTES